MKGVGDMEQTQERQAVEVCNGCGAKSGLSWALPWPRNPNKVDLYCDTCQADHRRHEACEEAIIGALKRAHLFDTYTLEHLQQALDGLSTLGPAYLAEAVERGTTAQWRRRPGRVDRRMFDVDPDAAKLSPADERHLLAAAAALDPGGQV